MKLLIIGDTHGHPERIDEALEQAGPVDLLIHTGDGWKDPDHLPAALSVVKVTGNCDRGVRGPAERLLDLGGHRIFVTHGHKHHVKYDLNRLYFNAREEKADIVVYGHTHQRAAEQVGDLLFLNPGSAWRPRDWEAPGFLLLELGEGPPRWEFHDLKD